MTAKSKALYEFYNGIYPRPLWVVIGGTVEDIKATFLNENEKEIMLGKEEFGAWTCGVLRKKDYDYGVVVWFPHREDMIMNWIAHEATHILAYFCEAYGLHVDCGFDNEHLAYLMGWICECINKARCKSVKPVEFNNKKKTK